MNAIRAELKLDTMFVGKVVRTHSDKNSLSNEAGIHAHLGSSDEASGSCIIIVTPDGERTMNTHLGAVDSTTDRRSIRRNQIKPNISLLRVPMGHRRAKKRSTRCNQCSKGSNH